MQIINTKLEGVVEIVPPKFGDERGFFSETHNKSALKEAGIDLDFCQDNHSFSAPAGTLRGLHYQLPPFAQDKLVRVTRGSVLDVAVDIRKGSPTFGHWAGVILSVQKWNQLLVPKGFAHGFVTLEPDTEFLYKVTNYYSRDHDRNIRFDDPAIGIDWAGDKSGFTLSTKDLAAPMLADAEIGFVYGETV